MINVGQSGLERMARAVVSRDRCLGHDFDGKGDMAAEDAAYYPSSAVDGHMVGLRDANMLVAGSRVL